MLRHIGSSFPRRYRSGIGDPLTLRLLALWQEKARELLPHDLFEAQTPKSFKSGVLTLGVENATIGAEIDLRAQKIIREINEKLKKKALEKVVFRVL